MRCNLLLAFILTNNPLSGATRDSVGASDGRQLLGCLAGKRLALQRTEHHILHHIVKDDAAALLDTSAI